MTPVLLPSSGACIDEASSKGSRSFARPAFPSPVVPLDGTGTLGFFLELHTPQLPAAHVEVGTGIENYPGYISRATRTARTRTNPSRPREREVAGLDRHTAHPQQHPIPGPASPLWPKT